jgi:anti-sigma regulatory factor (Ser/Thr protein kinase)
MLRLRRQLPATADSVAQLRTLAVAYALENCAAGEHLLDDVALAVSEAATNAVQHAYPDHEEPGPIELDAYHTPTRLVVQIADHGTGHRQGFQPGIGLRIIRLVARPDIRRDQDGTTVTMTFPCGHLDEGVGVHGEV